MPEPIAVQWSTDGRATNTMSKLAWILVWCAAWALLSSALVGLRAPLDWRRALVIVVLGIIAAGFVTTLENNLGAATWRDAEPLELFQAAAIAVAAAAAIWVGDRLLDR